MQTGMPGVGPKVSPHWVALSMRQPWLDAVLVAGKRVENRRWMTHHRGPFILHAARGCKPEEYPEAVHWMASRGLVRRASDPVTRANAHLPILAVYDAMVRGGFCGVTELRDVMSPGDWHGSASGIFGFDVDERWHMHEQFGFLLGRTRATAFVHYAGALNFFRVPDWCVRELGLPPTPADWLEANR